jgi:TIR domain
MRRTSAHPEVGPMTGRFSRLHVFVTYRRADSAPYAGRLHDALVNAFGEDKVFQDVAGIDPGEDFEVAIDAALDEADAVLVLIGPNWLAPGADGLSRLHDANDYVRIEVSKSLARNIRVVPILVGGAALPSGADLPEDLVPLTRRQAVELHDTDWRNDVESLMRRLRRESPAKRGRLAWVAAAALVLVASLGTWALLTDGNELGSDTLTDCPTSPEGWVPIFEGTKSVEVRGTEGSMTFDVLRAHYRGTSGEAGELVLVTTLSNTSGPPNYDHDVNRYQFLTVDGYREYDYQEDELWCFTSDPKTVSTGEKSDGRIGFRLSRGSLNRR